MSCRAACEFAAQRKITPTDSEPYLQGLSLERESGCGWGQGRAGALDRIDEGPWFYQPCLEAR